MIPAQEYYDKTVSHLIQQKARALSGKLKKPNWKIRCVYRSKDGKKCAAGVHIPDNLYKPSMESLGIIRVLQDYPELRKFFPADLGLASQLQILHDTTIYFSGPEFRERVTTIAEEFRLTPWVFV